MDLETLFKLSYGLYVVSSRKGESINGQIANTVFQVTSDPPQIGVSIYKQNYTYKFIQESRVFTVSILSKDTPLRFIGQFGFKSGRDINKFQGVKYSIGANGAPQLLENSVGYIECEVSGSMDVGTHVIFVGRVLDAQQTSGGEPLTYANYRDIKRGREPKSAPTYIEEKKEVSKMDKYECTVCGYIYDPAVGDPDSGIKPQTPFEVLPADWVCPVCGADKSQFVKVT